jgi:hypothetical protein
MTRRLILISLGLLGASAWAALHFGLDAPVADQRGPVSADAVGRALQNERVERERSMARYAETDNRHERERYEKDAAARRAAELEREQQIWRSDRITTCRDTRAVSRPIICVERIGPENRQLNAPVDLQLTWSNLPHGAYIRLWVRNGAAAGERWQYAGPNGAIVADFVASAPSGTRVLHWDGKSTWCAPADLPMLCDNGEVGEYVVRAAILTGTDPFWPSWPAQNPTPVRWLALSETTPIAFTGNPRVFDRLPSITFGPVNGPLRSLVPASYLIQSSRQEQPARLGPWRTGWTSRCRTIILGKPYSGRPELCFPNGRLDRYGLKLRPWDVFPRGTIEIAPDVMPPGEARERAQIAAFRRVAKVAHFITYREAEKAAPEGSHPNTRDPEMQRLNRAVTWTNQSQVYAYFHQERDRSYWIITLDQSIKSLNYEEYITQSESLTYRVDADGRTCLLQAGRRLTDVSDHRCPDGETLRKN